MTRSELLNLSIQELKNTITDISNLQYDMNQYYEEEVYFSGEYDHLDDEEKDNLYMELCEQNPVNWALEFWQHDYLIDYLLLYKMV